MGLLFPRWLLSGDWLGIGLPMGGGVPPPSLRFDPPPAFSSPVKLFLSGLKNCLDFVLPIFSPCSTARSW